MMILCHHIIVHTYYFFFEKKAPGRPGGFTIATDAHDVEIIFLVNLRLSFSETIESPDSSISYFIEISQD
jgi:hypothetical protein